MKNKKADPEDNYIRKFLDPLEMAVVVGYGSDVVTEETYKAFSDGGDIVDFMNVLKL